MNSSCGQRPFELVMYAGCKYLKQNVNDVRTAIFTKGLIPTLRAQLHDVPATFSLFRIVALFPRSNQMLNIFNFITHLKNLARCIFRFLHTLTEAIFEGSS